MASKPKSRRTSSPQSQQVAASLSRFQEVRTGTSPNFKEPGSVLDNKEHVIHLPVDEDWQAEQPPPPISLLRYPGFPLVGKLKRDLGAAIDQKRRPVIAPGGETAILLGIAPEFPTTESAENFQLDWLPAAFEPYLHEFPLQPTREAVLQWLRFSIIKCDPAQALSEQHSDKKDCDRAGNDLVEQATQLIEMLGLNELIGERDVRDYTFQQAADELRRLGVRLRQADIAAASDLTGPLVITEPCADTPPDPEEWPKERTYGPWRFRDGQCSYKGSDPMSINGRPLEILEILAKAADRGRRLTKREMASENATDDSVLPQLTYIRAFLRKHLDLVGDPIPRDGNYKETTWTADIEGARHAASAILPKGRKRNKGRIKARHKAR